MNSNKPLIFNAAGDGSIYQRLLATSGYEEGSLFTKTFGDGEIYHRLDTAVKHRDVVVVGDFSTNTQVLATYDVCNALFDETALGLTLVLPQHSLPERGFQRRVLLDLFRSTPHTPRGNRLVLVDALSHGTPDYIPVKTTPRRSSSSPAFEMFGHDAKPILLHTNSYGYLAREMMQHGDFELGEWDTTEIDGRPCFLKLRTNVRGRVVIIVSGTIDDTETMELTYMSHAVAAAGALVRKKIVAYYGYGTMERKVLPGEAVKAKIRARLLSSIPACPLGNHIIMCDLHTEGIPYYMESGLQPQHVYIAKHLVAETAREMCGLAVDPVLGRKDLALVDSVVRRPVVTATDAGRHNWVKSIGRDVRLGTAFGRKERTGTDKVEFVGVLGNVLNLDALEYDDKCGTATTAAEAAGGIRLDQYGATLITRAEGLRREKQLTSEQLRVELNPPAVTTVFACTHGLFVGAAMTKLHDKRDIFGEPIIHRVVASNTHPRSVALADGKFLTTRSVSYLLTRAVLD